MTENFKSSFKTLISAAGVILCALFGIWWGLRTGGAVYYLTGTDLRLFLCIIMAVCLLFQGYSTIKKDRKYNTLYRISLWVSGIMICLLLYGMLVIITGDIVLCIIRTILGIHTVSGAGGSVHLLIFGAHPEASPAEYGKIWGSRILNYENVALLSLPVSIIITACGAVHARRPVVHSCSVAMPRTGRASDADPNGTSCRIVHLSDLHMGSIVTSAYIRKVARKAAELQPDYIVITGDLVNHGFLEECDPEDLKKTEAIFRDLNRQLLSLHADDGKDALAASSRIFAILGNHDPLPEDPALQQFLKASDITLLHDQAVFLPEFTLAGRGSNHIVGRPPLMSWLPAPQDGKPLILLDHYPDGIQEAREAGVDLMLCGHTHSGQYFPCNLLVKMHYRHGLIHGYSQWGHTQAIVSSGTGYFQIPIRVGTDSEIVCIDMKSLPLI